MPRARTALLVLLGFLLGTGLGHILGRRSAEETVLMLRTQNEQLAHFMASRGAAMPPGVRGALDTALLRTEVQKVLREEAALHPQAPAGSNEAQKGAKAESVAPEATPESLAVLHSGLSLVDDALHTQRWGPEQVTRMRTLLPQLSDAQREQVLQRLLPAINRGEIVPEGTGPPL